MVRTLGMAACALLLALGAGACGDDDDDTGADATAADAAGPDATPPDAGPTACEILCSCTSSVCSQDEGACLTECAGLSATALSCRTEHCGFAQSDPTTHCIHARGEELCD